MSGEYDGQAPSDALTARVAANLARARERIAAAGGDVAAVRIVAVTKGFGLAAVRAALACGLTHLGENYADELVDKAELLAARAPEEGAQAAWHYLGAIQRNKVRRLAGRVACFEGVDRREEGERIATCAPGAQILVEVDCSGAPGRGGVAPAAVPELVAQLRSLPLALAGLMTVAPPEPAAARAAFATVARLRAELGLAQASMGMSDDLELAVAAGATSVRLGRALFGPRPRPGAAPAR